MKKIISFLLFVGLVFPYIVSIDSCAKYAQDGRQCRECITGFQLLNKSCYPKVRGCAQYSSDGECTRCEPKSFLSGNRCCDGACFEKLVKKSSETNTKYPIDQNSEKISQLIEIAENQLPDNVLAQLIWMDIKQLNGVERWFLLYRIQNSNTHYQRIVLDYNNKLKSLQNSVVDSSFARIPDEFNIVQWKEVENTQAVLKLFQGLYAGANYKEVSVKIAVLSEVKQFEIVAISEDIVSIRVLYQSGSQIVVLKETVIPVKSTAKVETPQALPSTPVTPETPSKKSETAKSSQPIVTVDRDGCTIHSTYGAPFSDDIQAMLERLDKKKQAEESKKINTTSKQSGTPLIGVGLGRFFRRIVATQPCNNSILREVAVVQGENNTYTEYFSYYLQIMDPATREILEQTFVGFLQKIQSAPIYKDPLYLPLSVTDPSILNYPYTNEYYKKGVIEAYRNRLTPEQARYIMGVTDDPTTEVNRKIGTGFVRWSINGKNSAGETIRKTGYRIVDGWDALPAAPGVLVSYADVCIYPPEMIHLETYIIGDSGKAKAQDPTPAKAPENQHSDSGKVTYTGVDIDAELDVNEPLIAAVNLLKTILPQWDYTLKTVQEETKSADIVEFVIIAQNSTGTVKAEVSYSHSSGKATLVELTQKGLEAQKPTESQKKPQKPVKANQPQANPSGLNLISQAPNVTVKEEGTSTHTIIEGALSPEHKALTERLLSLREESTAKSNSDNQTPIIGFSQFIGIGKTFRRLVITQVCSAGAKQYAYVQTDDYYTRREYFSYYIEFDHPITGQKMLAYAGTKNKTQIDGVFVNPNGYPIEMVDPSFVNYPNSAMFYEKGMIDMFRTYLIGSEATRAMTLKADAKTQRDRYMGDARRFAIQASDLLGNAKMTGLMPPETFKALFDFDNKMIVSICENSMVSSSETYVIGSAGPAQSSDQTATKAGNLSVGV